MKPTLSYLLTAFRSFQDSSSGMWSYIDVFNTLIIPSSLEVAVQTIYVAGKINNVPSGPADVKVAIHGANGELIAEVNMKASLLEGDLNLNVEFKNIILASIGRYMISVHFNGKKLVDGNRYYFEVKKDGAK